VKEVQAKVQAHLATLAQKPDAQLEQLKAFAATVDPNSVTAEDLE
jgi:hypothetical protein